MDTDRFDRLTRSLTTSRSRRGALIALLGGTLGLLGLAETDARKRKGKKKKKGGNRPTCRDRTKNGTETDVDCGGTCPRCPDGKICDSRNDCKSALCSDFGYCYACTSDDDCSNDAGGPCYCRQPAAGGANVCHGASSGEFSDGSCSVCPVGSVCFSSEIFTNTFECAKLCGAP